MVSSHPMREVAIFNAATKPVAEVVRLAGRRHQTITVGEQK
jgi:hypothetical protein